jgi:hypothetical protein
MRCIILKVSRNDLWRFNLSSGNWAFLNGYKGTGAVASTSGANAYPTGVANSGYWQVNDTYLYLFGGNGGWLSEALSDEENVGKDFVSCVASNFFSGIFNALWMYDIPNNQWSWVSGYLISNQAVSSAFPHYRYGVGSAGDNSRYGYIFGGWVCHNGRTPSCTSPIFGELFFSSEVITELGNSQRFVEVRCFARNMELRVWCM